MAKRYYLLSKDIGDGPYLIGELSHPDYGEYQFRYMIDGERFPRWFMQLPRMRDTKKVYGTRETLHLIIYRIVPQEGTWEAGILLNQFPDTHYDEWDLLELLLEQHERYRADDSPMCDSHQLFYFYKEIPKNANRFD